MKTALAYSDRDSETLTDWVALCQRLDNKIRSLKSRQAARTSSSWRTSTPATTTTTTAKTTTTATPTNAKAAVTSTHAGLMDLSLGATRNKVSVEEYARRQSQGLCFRCGGLGHSARDCPTLPANARTGTFWGITNPNRRKPLNASATATTTIDDSEALVFDSEKLEK